MGVCRHVDHDRLVLALQTAAEQVGEGVDELPRRAAEAHRVRQIVDLHGERDGDDLAAIEGLHIGTVVIEDVAMPGIAGGQQKARCAGSASRAG